MPKHRPIKFKSTLDPKIAERVKLLLKNDKAKSTLNATLGIIALGGVLTVGGLALGFLGIVGHVLNQNKKERYDEYRRIWKNFYSLKRKNDLKFVETKDGCDIYALTNKGEQKISKLIFQEMNIARPKKWDHKWRLVMFDIPERKGKERRSFALKLKELGFYQCQKSVWVHPFPCLAEVEFLKDTLGLKPYVKIFLVDEMIDGKVLYHFNHMLKKVILKQ